MKSLGRVGDDGTEERRNGGSGGSGGSGGEIIEEMKSVYFRSGRSTLRSSVTMGEKVRVSLVRERTVFNKSSETGPTLVFLLFSRLFIIH
jgi:hypothetical protein